MRHLLPFLIFVGLLGLACNLTAGRIGSTETSSGPAVLILPTSIRELDERTPTTIPVKATATKTAADTADVTPTPRPTNTLLPATATSVPPTPCSVRLEWPEYTVQAGDTLYRIAQRNGTTVDLLVQANCLSSRNTIITGMALRVPPTSSTAFPTTIPDGNNIVAYQADQCFSNPFLYDAGVSVGEFWRVAPHLDVLTLFDGQNSNRPVNLLQKGERFLVKDGPVCYTKTIGLGLHAFRRWRVSSLDRTLSGWIDEYDVFTEATSIEPSPEVIAFDVSPRVINTGDPITIEWEVEGANEVYIFSYHFLHRFASGLVTEDPWLPPSGSITVYAPTPLTHIGYSLGYAPEDSSRWATVEINCTEEYFAEPGDLTACPLGPVAIQEAAFQPFERGFMVWRPDKDQIWVLVEGAPGSHAFLDTWDGEEITFDQEPPVGLVRPVRGFGKVWVENEWVRQSLGWGTAVERAYTMEYQETQTSYAGYVHFFSLPDSRVVRAGQYFGASLDWEYADRR